MSETPKPAHPHAAIGGLAGAAAGWMFAEYTRASGWIPIGAAIVLLVVFAKTELKPKWFRGAIVLTLAQVVWAAVAGVVEGVWGGVIGDIVVLLILTRLLWVRPGWFTASLLGLVQLVSLAYNVHVIRQVPFGDAVHRVLTAHIVLRWMIIVLLVLEYLKYRREDGQAKPPAEAGPVALES
jgi:hypothetical protein